MFSGRRCNFFPCAPLQVSLTFCKTYRWAWRRGGSDGGRPCWWERTRSACGTSTPAARWPTSTTRRRRSSERWCTTSDRRSSDCRRAPNRWHRVVTWWYTGFILRGSARKRYRLKPELIETWLALSNFDQLFSGEKTVGFLTGWKLPILCAGRYLGSIPRSIACSLWKSE